MAMLMNVERRDEVREREKEQHTPVPSDPRPECSIDRSESHPE